MTGVIDRPPSAPAGDHASGEAADDAVPRRRHWFELADQRWLPRRLRRYLLDLVIHHSAAEYVAAVPVLAYWLRRCGCARVVDLCSASGGPWPHLLPALRAQGVDVQVLLTDLVPAPGPDAPGIRHHPAPVDAHAVPAGLGDCRTMFTALHHFPPDEAAALLQRAAEDGVPFAAFEFTARTRANALGMLLSPLRVWRDTARLPGRDPARWLWTYAVPVVPALYLWDGLVSHLRSYTPAELREMADAAAAPGYTWEVGTLGDSAVTYLLGIPYPSHTGSGRNNGLTQS